MFREETSTVAMMVSGGRGGVGRDRIISRKWLISWIWEGRDLTNG